MMGTPLTWALYRRVFLGNPFFSLFDMRLRSHSILEMPRLRCDLTGTACVPTAGCNTPISRYALAFGCDRRCARQRALILSSLCVFPSLRELLFVHVINDSCVINLPHSMLSVRGFAVRCDSEPRAFWCDELEFRRAGCVFNAETQLLLHFPGSVGPSTLAHHSLKKN